MGAVGVMRGSAMGVFEGFECSEGFEGLEGFECFEGRIAEGARW
jgi:hypothetical protein